MPDNPQVAASKSESRKDTGSTETALGLEFAQLDDRARQRYGIEEGVPGVVVASGSADSPVADTGISPGDVIVSVEHRAVVRKRVVSGARVSGAVELGGRRVIKKKKNTN